MRIAFTSDVRLKRVAKKLKKCAGAMGIEVKLTGAYNAMAKVYGYRDYHDLRAHIGMVTPTPWDGYVGPEEVRKRQAFQTMALAAALQMEKRTAARIIAEIAPTGGGSPSCRDNASFRAFGNSQSEPIVIVRKRGNLSGPGNDRRRVIDLTRPTKTSAVFSRNQSS